MKLVSLLDGRDYAIMIVLSCLAITSTQACGGVISYGNPAGAQDFTDGTNWVGGIAPGTGDEGHINGVDGTTNYAYLDAPLTIQRAMLGENAGDSGGLEIRSNGSLTGTSTSGHIVGRSGTGVMRVLGGYAILSGRLYVGQLTGSQGTVIQTGGGVYANGLSIAYDTTNSQGSYTLNDGLLQLSNSLEVGRNGVGVFSMNGGTLNATGRLNMGQLTGSNGTMTQSGGDVNTAGLSIAPDNAVSQGSYTLNSGNLTLSDSFEVGRTGTGVFTMHGGTLTTTSVLNGFVQIGRTGSGTFVQTAGDVTVGRNSATGYGFAIAPMAGSTGLYELSGGTLTIANTNLGMSIGTTNGSATSSGTFKVIGDSATIAIANNYTQFPGATLALEIGAGISPINTSANATLSGILDVSFSQTPTVGQQFTILNYGGTLTGAFATFDATVDSPAGPNSVGLSINYGTGLGSAVVLTVDSVTSPSIPGDFNGDGHVDGADFAVWQSHFPNASDASLSQGDADGDGDVDGADFVAWQTNYPYPAGGGAVPVPEPQGFMLTAIGGFLALIARRRGGNRPANR